MRLLKKHFIGHRRTNNQSVSVAFYIAFTQPLLLSRFTVVTELQQAFRLIGLKIKFCPQQRTCEKRVSYMHIQLTNSKKTKLLKQLRMCQFPTLLHSD